MENKAVLMHTIGNLQYVTFSTFDRTGLVHHCFSTRHGGISEGMFTSLNLGFQRGDKEENVRENYRLISEAIGVDDRDLVFSDQVHETSIYRVEASDRGKGISRESDIKGIDGLITNVPKVPLVTLYADCVSLFFLDPVQKAIGLSHGGWRGTVGKIGAKTVEEMQKAYGSNPEDILAGIGPSIGPCCFEVDKPVADQFQNYLSNIEDCIEQKANGKYHIDLWTVNQKVLIEAGIKDQNITKAHICTQCHKDTFFSHRGHRGKRGNLAAIMELV